MNNRPRIYVVLRHYKRKGRWQNIVQEAHLEQVLKHGGVPVPLPRVPGTEEVLDHYGPMHGLLIVEGRDLDIRRYGGIGSTPETLLETPDLSRDQVEFKLIAQALALGVPYLGVCRGIHLLNAALGGTLWGDVMHDLKSDLKHVDYDHYDDYRHHLTIEKNTPLHAWLGKEEIQANSFHHQGVKDLGKGLLPLCRSDDGLVEGVYDPRQDFCVGLQFHPERLANEEPGCERVYQDFVKAAKAFMKKS